MPKHKCGKCHHRRCVCMEPKLPLAKVEAVCPPPKIRPGLPLCNVMTITFEFFEGRDISPLRFEAIGLYNISNGCLQSVSTAFFSPNKAPTAEILDQSTICLEIPGSAGSITGEVYFFGDNIDYTASLKPYLLEDGHVATLLTNFVSTTVPANTSVQLVFVARLFYCTCSKHQRKRRSKHC